VEAEAQCKAWAMLKAFNESGCGDWAEYLEWKQKDDEDKADLEAQFGIPGKVIGYDRQGRPLYPDSPKEKPEASGPSLAKVVTQYLTDRKAAIGLNLSIGISQLTYDADEYRIQRAVNFFPEGIHLNQIDADVVKDVVMAIAAMPAKLSNSTHKTKDTSPMSQSTALAIINGLKKFIKWVESQEQIKWQLPKGAKVYLDKLKPEPEEAEYRNITIKEFSKLWHGCKNDKARTADKGEKRKLFLALALNCGAYQIDIATLEHAHLHLDAENGNSYVWRMRRKTRKTNKKLAKTKWLLWPETVTLLKQYMAKANKAGDKGVSLAILDETGQCLKHGRTDNVDQPWGRLLKSSKMTEAGISFSNLRDTGADFMQNQRGGGEELQAMYLGHARKGSAENYADRAWDRLSEGLTQFREQYLLPAIAMKPEKEEAPKRPRKPKAKKSKPRS
jgi:integrase